MNVSKPLDASNQDYFEKLFSPSTIKNVTIATFFVASIMGLLLMFGVIWYERRGRFRYRTVINQLFSSVCWTMVWFILLIYIPDGIRVMTGPLNETFCEVHTVLKQILKNCILLTYDAIILLRYIFIFKMPNFTVINDDFITRCLVLSIVLLSTWSGCVSQMGNGVGPVVDFVCAVIDPYQNRGVTYYEDAPRKMPTTEIIAGVSIILHIFVNIKIYFYKREGDRATLPRELGTLNIQKDEDRNLPGEPNKSQPTIQEKSFNKTMVDFSTQILFLFNIASIGILSIVNSIFDPSQIHEESNYWSLQFMKIFGPFGPFPGICALTVCLTYYWQNDALREFLSRKIAAFWNNA